MNTQKSLQLKDEKYFISLDKNFDQSEFEKVEGE